MDLERQLAEARELDAQTWAALVEHGMGDGAALEVESFFYTADEAGARGLAAALVAAGESAAVDSSQERSGLFRKRTTWSVRSTVTVPAASLSAVQEHSATMLRLADAHGAEFDGWGAAVPS